MTLRGQTDDRKDDNKAMKKRSFNERAYRTGKGTKGKHRTETGMEGERLSRGSCGKVPGERNKMVIGATFTSLQLRVGKER